MPVSEESNKVVGVNFLLEYPGLFLPGFRVYSGVERSRAWQSLQREWKRLNPGLQQCSLCNLMIAPAEFSLDHILPQVDYPNEVYEITNLQPAHRLCNTMRGTILGSPAGYLSFWNRPEYREFAEKIVSDYKKVLERV